MVLATAQAQDESEGFVNTSLQCVIKVNGTGAGYMYNTFPGEGAILRMTVQVPVTLLAAGDLSLFCGTTKGASATGVAGSVEGRISAIKVGALHLQVTN
jgi:hypothetical protein